MAQLVSVVVAQVLCFLYICCGGAAHALWWRVPHSCTFLAGSLAAHAVAALVTFDVLPAEVTALQPKFGPLVCMQVYRVP